MNRVIPFFAGAGVVAIAYGNLRENLFQQQRSIRTKLSSSSPEDDSPTRTAILSELENKRRSLFQQIGDEWNDSILNIYQAVAGVRPK
jgi:hypothetical protein